MASQNRIVLVLVFFTSLLIHKIFSLQVPFNSSKQPKPCKSLLYQHNDLTEDNISSLYSVDKSQIQSIGHGDHLVTVPCSCQNVSNTVAYFYDATYSVKLNDTFLYVSDQLYSGQGWYDGTSFKAKTNVTMHLLCGCTETDSQVMVTYTVEQHDTLSDIANRLSSKVVEIESVNKLLPGFIEVGQVLFVPMFKNGVPPSVTL